MRVLTIVLLVTQLQHRTVSVGLPPQLRGRADVLSDELGNAAPSFIAAEAHAGSQRSAQVSRNSSAQTSQEQGQAEVPTSDNATPECDKSESYLASSGTLWLLYWVVTCLLCCGGRLGCCCWKYISQVWYGAVYLAVLLVAERSSEWVIPVHSYAAGVNRAFVLLIIAGLIRGGIKFRAMRLTHPQVEVTSFTPANVYMDPTYPVERMLAIFAGQITLVTFFATYFLDTDVASDFMNRFREVLAPDPDATECVRRNHQMFMSAFLAQSLMYTLNSNDWFEEMPIWRMLWASRTYTIQSDGDAAQGSESEAVSTFVSVAHGHSNRGHWFLNRLLHPAGTTSSVPTRDGQQELHRLDVFVRVTMSFLANFVVKHFLILGLPLVLYDTDPVDFVKDCFAVGFVSGIDDIASQQVIYLHPRETASRLSIEVELMPAQPDDPGRPTEMPPTLSAPEQLQVP